MRWITGMLIATLSMASLAEPQTYGWHDGTTWRTLNLDPQWEADFSPSVQVQGPRAVLRPVNPTATKSSLERPFHSPVLRDESGTPRALPGGVMVVLHKPLDDNAARALFQAAGVQPVRRIQSTIWLIASPAGLPSLDVAKRLHESGWFQSAEPNWWTPRALK
jgi:hypothetical protein